MESLETINYWLKRDFGLFDDMRPNWRIVWSEDQFEQRWVTHTPHGIELPQPVVTTVPKYRQYLHNKYILERLVPMDMFTKHDLVLKLSYEPTWVFEDKDGNALPPNYEVAKIVITSIYTKASSYYMHKTPQYKDPDWNKNEAFEVRKARIEKLQEQLFGNETDITDAIAHKQAVVLTDRKMEIPPQNGAGNVNKD